jgi:hypothetical protein
MLQNVIGLIRPRSPSRSPSPVPNGHSDDEPWGDADPRLRIYKANAAELGVAPFRITEQMRGRNILGDLTLKQVQQFKTNHEKKILGVGGGNGTTAEHEALLTEYIERLDQD